MSNLIGIYDHNTGENLVREMTVSELAERTKELKEIELENAKETLDAKNAEIAKNALLTKLGITADEAKLLLG